MRAARDSAHVDLLLIAVDNGPDRMVYAGLVMSHYEFIVPGPTLKHLSDSDWRLKFGWWPTFDPPKRLRPEWTRSYLIPK